MNTKPYKKLAKVFGIIAIITIPVILSGYLFVFQGFTPQSAVPSEEVESEQGAIQYHETGSTEMITEKYTEQSTGPHMRNPSHQYETNVYEFDPDSLSQHEVEKIESIARTEDKILLEQTETFTDFSGNEIVLYTNPETPHTHVYKIDPTTQYTQTGSMYQIAGYGTTLLLIIGVIGSITIVGRHFYTTYS